MMSVSYKQFKTNYVVIECSADDFFSIGVKNPKALYISYII